MPLVPKGNKLITKSAVKADQGLTFKNSNQDIKGGKNPKAKKK